MYTLGVLVEQLVEFVAGLDRRSVAAEFFDNPRCVQAQMTKQKARVIRLDHGSAHIRESRELVRGHIREQAFGVPESESRRGDD